MGSQLNYKYIHFKAFSAACFKEATLAVTLKFELAGTL